MLRYHDEEWGVPLHDDRRLFEILLLEGFQAGLSWPTILHKRENFRTAFDGFDPAKIARYGERDQRRLLADPGIVRNSRKIEAAIGNAGAFLKVREEHGSFDRYIWQFTGYTTLRRSGLLSWRDVPSSTPESDAMAKDLKRRGFRFAGTTICYAFMQTIGMVNDHNVSCFLAPPESTPQGTSTTPAKGVT
ncbi:MAG: DNA-3-methyladenine glycosylase I [Chloroflexi bacterium]|nr:DNA-3-methyladenine glycosylase I [Chloroflexota bacterium]